MLQSIRRHLLNHRQPHFDIGLSHYHTSSSSTNFLIHSIRSRCLIASSSYVQPTSSASSRTMSSISSASSSSSPMSSTDESASAESSTSPEIVSSSSSDDIYKGKARVYTKTGDKGTTSLFNMERRSKADDYFSVLGDTDELNAHLGVVRAHCTYAHEHDTTTGSATAVHTSSINDLTTPSSATISTHHQLNEQLTEIQSRLFDLGAHIATPIPTSNEAQIHRTSFHTHHVTQLESWIDDMERSLPPLRNFILPGGSLLASHLHIARAVCRRAERGIVVLVERGDSAPVVQHYLNRLSDYLFVAARYAALTDGAKETIWKKPREPRQRKGSE